MGIDADRKPKGCPIVSPRDGSDLLTMASVASSAVGMLLAVSGLPRLAIVPLVACGILDSFDGRFASSFDRSEVSRSYGAELDSVSDAMAFGSLPACMLLSSARTGSVPWYAVAVSVIFLMCVARRLAWFGALDRTGTSDGSFVGLPTTYASIVLPVVHTLVEIAGLSAHAVPVMACTMLALALAFVANVPIARPGTKTILAFAAVGVACAVRIVLTEVP